ncbi:hypothetical protein [Desulfobacula sp.]|uniref:hypothetical protein n=1 Tax=Desulfobacula sp. TaxID=2593537 RepID=UPI00262019FB|nr:hypothetical protein [Desulfobacula sp.]
MSKEKYNIEKLPFFQSFVPNSPTKAVIDIQEFHLWLERVQHMDFLSNAEERERYDAYKELENVHALDLKDAMNEW